MFQKQVEYLSLLVFTVSVLGLPFLSCILFGYCLLFGYITRYLAIAYLIHMFYDLKYNEGIPAPTYWFRNSFFFDSFFTYFSMRMKATAEIPHNHNYIIGMHPHGFLTYSAVVYSSNNTDTYKEIFGNGTVIFCTAPFNLQIPLQRDIFKGLGAIAASEPSITRRLTSGKSGNHVAIVLGGADEALLMSATEHRIILKKRKGFCRIALKTGSHLLPSYAFGESRTFDTVKPAPGSFLQKAQQFLLKYLKIGAPILKGSWKYQYFFVMPHRTPIITVFGKPIPVVKVANPTREQVDELHDKYIKNLVELFENNKETYLGDKNAKLIIE